MKRRIAAGVVGTIAVLGLAYVPASSLEPGFERVRPKKHLFHTFRLGDVTALEEAAHYAAWCGGVVEIWSDGDIIAGSCDK
jgi:hypothetical protein